MLIYGVLTVITILLIIAILKNYSKLKKLKSIRKNENLYSVEAVVDSITNGFNTATRKMTTNMKLIYEVDFTEYMRNIKIVCNDKYSGLSKGDKVALLCSYDDPNVTILTEDYEEVSLKKSIQTYFADIICELIFLAVAWSFP